MGQKSKIEWTDATWNPVTGCTKVSTGCKNCYAERLFPRVYGKDTVLYHPNTMNPGTRPREFTDVKLHPDRLEQPLHWKKSRMIFVNSMSDLFHEDVPFEFIAAIFGIMSATQWHTYQILTKRPKRAIDFFKWLKVMPCLVTQGEATRSICYEHAQKISREKYRKHMASKWWGCIWPLPNVWLGISCENQETADERIPLLLQVPAAVRFLSCEPLLAEIDLGLCLGVDRKVDCGGCTASPVRGQPYCPGHDAGGIDWVIAGGESGPGYRPMNLDWARSIRDQCASADVPFFFKQTAGKKEIPDDLMIREYPK